MRKLFLTVAVLLGMAYTNTAGANCGQPHKPWHTMTLKQTKVYQVSVIECDKHVMKETRKYRVLVWHRKQMAWTRRELRETLTKLRARAAVASTSYWINKQIMAAEAIARSSGGDPWPNCPDPHDGGGSWQDTVNCENSGNWYDSPGYFRCGLQFEPRWETVYGRLCP
jgi:hypothetical protein